MNEISIVIPAYRAAATISCAIDSIFASVDVKPEIIIVEDGVYDNLRDVLEDYKNITLITNDENLGAAATRNIGLNSVKSPYVFFLDADDYVDPLLFTRLIAALRTKDAGMAFGPWRFVYHGVPNRKIHLPKSCSNSAMVAGWLRSECVPCCAVLWSTEVIRQIGGWNPDFRHNDDAELILRALIREVKFAVAHEGCGYYVQHDSPYRVSRPKVEVSSRAALGLYEMVEAWLPKLTVGREELLSSLAYFAYEQARRGYRAGAPRIGGEWLARARALGLKGHPGSSLHSFLSNVLGLRIKESLASNREKMATFRHHYK